jgi:hypothetical protein
VSCSLDPPALEGRLDRWRRLADRALLESSPIPGGLRRRYRGERDVEDELRALIAAEDDCCPALTFALARAGRELVLELSGPVELVGFSSASSPSPRS